MSSLNSSQVLNPSLPAHSMDDINMLLYLDALQRSVDNQNFIAQKVEEAYKNYQKRYHMYASLYARYVALIKKATTRKLLKQNTPVELNLPQAEMDIKSIIEKLNDDVVTAYINLPDLEAFTNKLSQDINLENLESLRGDLVQLKSCVEAIQSSVEAIEAALDNGIIQSLNLYAEELHMSNFPKIAMKTKTLN